MEAVTECGLTRKLSANLDDQLLQSTALRSDNRCQIRREKSRLSIRLVGDHRHEFLDSLAVFDFAGIDVAEVALPLDDDCVAGKIALLPTRAAAAMEKRQGV